MSLHKFIRKLKALLLGRKVVKKVESPFLLQLLTLNLLSLKKKLVEEI